MSGKSMICGPDVRITRSAAGVRWAHSGWVAIALAAAVSCNSSSSTPVKPTGPSPALQAANRAVESGRAASKTGDMATADRYADEAIADAGSYLRGDPYGTDAANAFYLQGRGYELKVAAGPTEASGNLSQARSAYQLALGRSPSSQLEGNIRASLSNVAFFQDDFASAIDQASQAMKMIDSNEVKSLLLFRIGVSQQRLGEWTTADQTFNTVVQKYSRLTAAEAAREHTGERQFYVQIATYNSPDAADKALLQLTGTGTIVTRRSNAQGRTVADTGPFATYKDAKRAKEQLGPAFPDALIVP